MIFLVRNGLASNGDEEIGLFLTESYLQSGSVKLMALGSWSALAVLSAFMEHIRHLVPACFVAFEATDSENQSKVNNGSQRIVRKVFMVTKSIMKNRPFLQTKK